MLMWRAAIVLAAGLLAYSNSMSGPFLFDDESSIIENPAIRSFGTVTSERFNSPLSGRPVVGFTFAINYALGGLETSGYHATNIAIHLCSALLLFGLVRRTLTLPRLRKRFGAHAPDLATAVALIWTVHPLNTEAVNYITQRTELLLGLFYLLTLYGVARSHSSMSPWRWRVVAIVACALGMASKESMVTAPFMVLLYERVFVFGGWTQMFQDRSRVYFYGGLALTWIVLARLVLPGPRASSAGFSTNVSVWTYLLNQAVMIVRYLRLAVWPNALVVNYGPPLPLTFRAVLPHAALIVTLIGLTLVALRRRPLLGFAGAWIFITLAPTSSIVPIATEVGAERRMYLPLIAVVALAVIGTYAVMEPRRRLARNTSALLVAVMVLALGAATAARNREYQSSLRIAEQDLRRWPTDYTHGALGSELARAGRDEEAIRELRIGAPANPRTKYNLGVALFNRKQYDEAIRHLTALASEHPTREEVPWARRIIGHAYSIQGKWPEAIAEFRSALRMAPNDKETRRLYATALNSYGIELGTAGEHGKAADAFRQSLEQDPNAALVRHNLATALLDSGDLRGAVAEAKKALEERPTDASLYNVLGRALAMQGEFKDALVYLAAAVKLRSDDPAFREDLRRVQEFLGRRPAEFRDR